MAVGFAVAVVVALSVLLVKVIPPPGSPERLPDPPAGLDRAPAGPVIRTFPKDCAVSAATVGRLVTEPRLSKITGQGGCQWSSGGDGKSRRLLSVAPLLSFGGITARYPALPGTGRSPVSAAMRSFGPKWTGITSKAVTGLGDEALVQFSPSTGATVVARVGNAKVTVQYRGTYMPIPEKTALDGALAVAAEVVARLGARVPPRPVVAPAAHPTPARTIPDLCGSVSDRTLRHLVKGDVDAIGSARSARGLFVRGARHRACSWTSMEHDLTVSVAVVPGTELFDGIWRATREHTIRLFDARAEEPLSVRDKKYFYTVAGLGDQAFAAHVPGVIPGVIVFRDGDLLVQVTYEKADEREPLSGEHALRGAYAVAQEAAQAISAR